MFLGYILINDIYLDIFKSPPKQFINAQTGTPGKHYNMFDQIHNEILINTHQ